MTGMDRNTGRELSGSEHLRQSVTDILTTPKGSRVMRRAYGSRLFELMDQPFSGEVIIELYAAVAYALAQWEPRYSLLKVSVESIEAGSITLTLEGVYLPNGKQVTLEGIIV